MTMQAATPNAAAASHGNALLPQHDPTTRELIAIVGMWQVRQFIATDPRMLYGKTHGLSHVQLWQPSAMASVLTPSRLTGGKFEFFDGSRRFAVATWDQLCRHPACAGFTLPGTVEVASLQHWLVSPHEDGAMALLRAWWQGTPLKSWLHDRPTRPRGDRCIDESWIW